MSEQPDILEELCGLLSRNTGQASYIRDRAMAEITTLRKHVAEMQRALLHIGYEPVGQPEATHAQVMDECVEIARRALKACGMERKF